MEFEELTQGQPEDDEPTGLSPLTWTAIAVVCVLAGLVFLIFQSPTEPLAGPTPAHPGVARTGLSLIEHPAEKLNIGGMCPAVTDGAKTLIVSFTLVNISTMDVVLMDVKPVLPVGGLRSLGANRAGGTCEHPATEAVGGLLTPGESQLITMRFRLPKVCPQAYPLQSRVRLVVNQMVGTTTVPVYSDLGVITFDSCPGQPLAGPTARK